MSDVFVSLLGSTEFLVVGSGIDALNCALNASRSRRVILIGSCPFPAWELTGRWDFDSSSWQNFSILRDLPCHGKYPYPAAIKWAVLNLLEKAGIHFFGNMFPICRVPGGMIFAGAGKIWLINAAEIMECPVAAASWKTKAIRWSEPHEVPDWIWEDRGISITESAAAQSILASAYPEGEDIPRLSGGTLPDGCRIQNCSGEQHMNIPEIAVEPEEYDVIVAGGGTAGCAAAIAAAREHGKVLLLERFSALGGLATNGRITNYFHGNRVGFAAETDRAASELSNGRFNEFDGSWKVEARKRALLNMARAAGVKVLFHQEVCGALKNKTGVCGVLSASFNGPCVYLGKTVIDATGNADVAAAAGARCQFMDDEPALQGTGVPALIPGQENSNSDFTFTSDQNPNDISRTLRLASEIFKDKFDFGPVINSRERRRIIAVHNLTPEDAYAHRKFRDCIVRCYSRFDTHGFMTDRFFELNQPSTDAVYVELPYRSLLPEKMDGLLVTGLGLGASRDAMPFIRMQPDVLNHGFAAGLAAMLAVRTHRTLRRIPVRELQKQLIANGILPHGYEHHTSQIPVIAPLPQDVQNIHECVGAILLQPDRYLPELEQRCRKSHDLRYAQLLAIMGNAAGAEWLAEEVASFPFADDIPGWDYKGMGQSGRCASRIDSIIHSLARLPEDYAAAGVLERLKEIQPDSAFSHFRSIGCYLMKHPTPRAVTKLDFLLADLLKHPAQYSTEPLDTQYRNWRLKCFYLAQALLACQKDNIAAVNFLKDCQQRNEGAFAECADQLLNKFNKRRK